MFFCHCFHSFIFENISYIHGRTGRKKLGGRKEICPTFSDCAQVVKKNFPEKRSKIVVDGGGWGGRSDYEKLLLHSIFPTILTEFHTKLTEFVPFIFIISQYCPTVKRILPDWLCFPNKLGGLPPPSPPRPVRPWLHNLEHFKQHEKPRNDHAVQAAILTLRAQCHYSVIQL